MITVLRYGEEKFISLMSLYCNQILIKLTDCFSVLIKPSAPYQDVIFFYSLTNHVLYLKVLKCVTA